jgi:hypothetical protein
MRFVLVLAVVFAGCSFDSSPRGRERPRADDSVRLLDGAELEPSDDDDDAGAELERDAAADAGDSGAELERDAAADAGDAGAELERDAAADAGDSGSSSSAGMGGAGAAGNGSAGSSSSAGMGGAGGGGCWIGPWPCIAGSSPDCVCVP